ncbi:MAG: hypothetical protein UH853_07665, partial [Muribaculaceae bacterium]|nr:hypothetical protein [Muribaculaceae bacterium]
MKRIFVAVVAIWASLSLLAQNYELTPDRKLRYAAAIIDTYYVDSVDTDHMVEEAIKAMDEGSISIETIEEALGGE